MTWSSFYLRESLARRLRRVARRSVDRSENIIKKASRKLKESHNWKEGFYPRIT